MLVSRWIHYGWRGLCLCLIVHKKLNDSWLCCSAFQQQRFARKYQSVLCRLHPLDRQWQPFTRLFYQLNNHNNRYGNHNSDNNNNNNNDDGRDLNNHPFNRRRQQEEFEAMAKQRHMEQVRNLQRSFYTTSTSHLDNPKQPVCQLDKRTGRLLQLPLWRDGQWQLPGRSNVLEITDPVYTNMFESILYKPQPWCFGHLYLKENANDVRKNDSTREQPLSTWKDVSLAIVSSTTAKDPSLVQASYPSSTTSAVLGCLMHIADYRRMSDGRLWLLVHAMERFVVTDIVRQLPYSIVNAQILPDVEEMDPLLLPEINEHLKERELQAARALAVQESVQYHAYEYDPHHSFSTTSICNSESKFVSTYPKISTVHKGLGGNHVNSTIISLPPFPLQQHFQKVEEPTAISLGDIAKVLPFCPFSKTPLDQHKIVSGINDNSHNHNSNKNNNNDDYDDDEEPCLEYRLLHHGILKVPPVDPDFAIIASSSSPTTSTPIDELEYQLWLAINHFLITTKLPVSPVLLSLLPPKQQKQHKHWPSNFYLHKIAKELSNLETMEHDYVKVSSSYPSYRRQRRLSFSAAYLLEDYYYSSSSSSSSVNGSHETTSRDDKDGYEDTAARENIKELLLSIPSTQQRLRVVLEKFWQWQQQTWGEFQ